MHMANMTAILVFNVVMLITNIYVTADTQTLQFNNSLRTIMTTETCVDDWLSIHSFTGKCGRRVSDALSGSCSLCLRVFENELMHFDIP